MTMLIISTQTFFLIFIAVFEIQGIRFKNKIILFIIIQWYYRFLYKLCMII